MVSVQQFGLVVLEPNKEHSLPKAEIRFTIDCAKPHRRVVDRAAIVLDVKRCGVLESHQFDGGKVVVDVDENGQILSVEIVSFPGGPSDLPELVTFIVNNDQWMLSLCLINTMQHWLSLQRHLASEDAESRAAFREGLRQKWRFSEKRKMGEHSLSVDASALRKAVWA